MEYIVKHLNEVFEDDESSFPTRAAALQFIAVWNSKNRDCFLMVVENSVTVIEEKDFFCPMLSYGANTAAIAELKALAIPDFLKS